MRGSIFLILLIAFIAAGHASRINIKVGLEEETAQDSTWIYPMDNFIIDEDDIIGRLQISDALFGNDGRQNANDVKLEKDSESTNSPSPLELNGFLDKDILMDPLGSTTSIRPINTLNEAGKNLSQEIVENFVPGNNLDTNLNHYNNNAFQPRRIDRLVRQEEIEQLILPSINERKKEISDRFEFKTLGLSSNGIGFTGAFFNIKNDTCSEKFLKYTKLGSIGKLISSQGIMASNLIAGKGQGDKEDDFIIYQRRYIGESKVFLQRFQFYLNNPILNVSPIYLSNILTRLTSEGHFPALWAQFTPTGELVAINMLPYHLALYTIGPYGAKEISARSLETSVHEVKHEKAVALITFEAKEEFEKISPSDFINTPVNDLWVTIWKQIGHVIGAELILLPIASPSFYK